MGRLLWEPEGDSLAPFVVRMFEHFKLQAPEAAIVQLFREHVGVSARAETMETCIDILLKLLHEVFQMDAVPMKQKPAKDSFVATAHRERGQGSLGSGANSSIGPCCHLHS